MHKKVLILTNSAAGLFNFRGELVEKLILEDYQVYFTGPETNDDKRVQKLLNMGAYHINTFIERRGMNPFKDLKLFVEYIKIIRDIKPDKVLSYTVKPNIYGGLVCRGLRIPYIANITGLGTAVEQKGMLQRLIIFLYKLSLKRANCIFFQNRENEQFFIDNKIKAKKTKLIPGSGVNLNRYNRLDYPEDNTVGFLFIGRIMKEKGIDQFLEAAEFIKNKYPNTIFHIVGSCDDRDYLEKLNKLHEKGIILFHGRQDDVRDFYKNTHCTVHPSYYPEGMSNVLLESAACGRPVITTNRSGCREIVDNEVSGFIVKQKDSQDLINKIERFLSLDHNAKKHMGLFGREKVEKEFDRNIVIDTYINEIN